MIGLSTYPRLVSSRTGHSLVPAFCQEHCVLRDEPSPPLFANFLELTLLSTNPRIHPRPMKSLLIHPLAAAEAALWWLGQAGYIVRAGDATVAIDPYLTDSAATNAPEFTRLFPPPMAPEELRVDVYVIEHETKTTVYY